jgi:hypothetical protein
VSDSRVPTQRQIRRMQKLAREYGAGTRERSRIARRADWQSSREQPNGRATMGIRIQRVQSYLHVHG